VRSGHLHDKIHIGLDYFDASINRVAAWVIGTRNMIKALLIALLEPTGAMEDVELKMDFTRRLVMLEEQKSLPWAAVWDYYCEKMGVPVGTAWFDEVRRYEAQTLLQRGRRRRRATVCKCGPDVSVAQALSLPTRHSCRALCPARDPGIETSLDAAA